MVRPRSIRFQLLVAVNVTMAGLLLVVLVVDYNRELADRMTEKRVALEEEAKTLLPAVARLRPEGVEAVQEYVDSVCGAMRDAQSPGHHIAVRLDETVLQALAHHRASPEMFQAMEAAAGSSKRRATFGDDELVVGVNRQGDLTVYVSEQLANVRRSVRREIIRRLAGIALLAVAATVVVNLVFLRIVAKPLQRLVGTVRQIAQGQLGAQAGPFNSQEFTYLADAVNTMSSSLADADRRRREEMAKARQIQEHLSPSEVDVPGLTLVCSYEPATEVAGDYYDVLSLPDGSWVLCVADVTGHGVPAAMSAAMLKTLLMHATEQQSDLRQILGLVNDRFLAVTLSEDFATMFLARWIPETGTLEYASAGHETALLCSVEGTLRELPSTGLLLGVQEDAVWEVESFPVNVGDRLLSVSDGVTEACSPQGELFGRDRLAQVFVSCRQDSASEAMRRIGSTLAAHRGSLPPSDDATMVLVEFATREV